MVIRVWVHEWYEVEALLLEHVNCECFATQERVNQVVDHVEQHVNPYCRVSLVSSAHYSRIAKTELLDFLVVD